MSARRRNGLVAVAYGLVLLSLVVLGLVVFRSEGIADDAAVAMRDSVVAEAEKP